MAAWDVAGIERELHSKTKDGGLSDLHEVQQSSLENPAPVEPWRHLPMKLWKSQAATQVFNCLLDNTVPGTSVSYMQILKAITGQAQKSKGTFCYLVGGQVRDVVRGELSKDVDINYTCSAQDVARICVENQWPVKYKAIDDVKPNYVMIGDESSGLYMEGFHISFHYAAEAFKMDFRQNLILYDLTNHVIIDKSGYAVDDIRNREFRLSCAPALNFEEWGGADVTLGHKALRYVKFIVRAALKGKPLKTDKSEARFVITLLRRAFHENSENLSSFWFGHVLGECLKTQQGLCLLHKWVCDQNGPFWWEEWLPFVKPHVDEGWLSSLEIGTPPGPTQQPDILKCMFEKSGVTSNGFIDQEDLKNIMQTVGVTFTDDDFEFLFAPSQSACSKDQVNYEQFIDRLCGA